MNYDEQIAVELGVECAILLSNIQFWVKKNRANREEKHFHDGRWWTYNSAGSFAKLFPYWKERSIYNYLEKLEKTGYIMSGNYNQFKYDRTKWYTTDGCKNSVYKVMEIHSPTTVNPSAKSANASTEICGPIPDINTDINTDILVNTKDTVGAKPRRNFVAPCVEEVSVYCKERKNGIDPQSFIDFYDSKGWMIGKNHMKDWKAAVRTWERRHGGGSAAPKPKPKPRWVQDDPDDFTKGHWENDD